MAREHFREENVDREALVSEKSTQSVTNTAKKCNTQTIYVEL